MQQYKFRGKRIADGKWLYGSLINNVWFLRDGKPCYFIIDTALVENYSDWDDLMDDDELFEVIPETVGMLLHTEKNGREWYEGDIARKDFEVSHDDYLTGEPVGFYGYRVGVVTLDIRSGMIMKGGYLMNIDKDECVNTPGNTRPIIFSRTKIIGTKWDNSELLTRQNSE